MASPQVEDGYTRIANEILENLYKVRISGREWQVLLVILRKTYGFQKTHDCISMGQFSELTGMTRPDVAEQIKKLLGKTLIAVTQNPNSLINCYTFQKDHSLWKVLPKKQTVTQNPNTLLPKTLTKVLPKTLHTKEKKETNTKEIKITLPDWISSDSLEAYKEMRKKKKAGMTDHALQLVIKKLSEFREQGQDPNKILDQSTMNNWTGIFPLKDEQGGGNGQKSISGRNGQAEDPLKKWAAKHGLV